MSSGDGTLLELRTTMKTTNNYKKVYYVYIHVDPATKEVLYVGKGTRHRAWVYQESKWTKNEKYRSQPHLRRLCKLVRDGFLPGDWVKIVERSLTNRQALDREKEYIKKLSPTYNAKFGTGYTKLTLAKLKRGISLYKKGIQTAEIARRLGVTHTIIYNSIVNPSPRYLEMREELNG